MAESVFVFGRTTVKTNALKPFETPGTTCPATVSHPRRLESSAERFRESPAFCPSRDCPLQVVKPAQMSVETSALTAGFEL
jgi:hypothetical protein